jgi:hypothetical protein
MIAWETQMRCFKKMVFAALALAAACAWGADGGGLKNWFNDPFFQVSAGIPSCPLPLGPLVTEAEMKAESHSRVERGTSCWMAGECKQPNAYLYDAGIAQTIRQRLQSTGAFDRDSLWITVSRRFVWAEGCVTDPRKAAEIEALLRTVPDVERVLVNVTNPAMRRPAYRTLRDEKDRLAKKRRDR